jgi:CRP-like cAMP-binding protein
VPEIASDEDLAAANALMQISSFGSTAFGFALAGLITSRFPIAWAFYIDGITYGLSAACILLTHIPHIPAEGRANVATVLHNLSAGMTFLFRTPVLRSLFIICLPVFLGYGLHNALLLPFAVRALGASEFEYGLLEGLSAGGFIVGALLMVRLADRLHEGQWVALSYLAIGLGKFVIAALSSVPLAISIYVILGIVNAPNYIGRSLILQRYTTRDVRGRVNSAFLVTRNVMYLLGMATAGLADVLSVRWLMITSGLLVVVGGLVVLVMPGLGQPAAEWRRALAMLRAAHTAPGLGLGRAATLADLDLLLLHLPGLSGLSAEDRKSLAKETRIYDAPAGTAIVRQGEQSDAAYFILGGHAIAGRDDASSYQSLEALQAGDFFGEIAALTGVARTANVITEQPTQVLQVPAATLRRLMNDSELNRLFLSKMTERMLRMNMLDLPRLGALDQQSLRELRQPDRSITE